MQRESSSSVQIFWPKTDRKEIIRQLKEKLKLLDAQLPLSYVVLFGSYAQGNYTVASDIDLLIIYRGKRREDAFMTAKKVLDIRMLEPHIYSEDEHETLKKTIHRMAKDGIVLFALPHL